jgi:hypothetical protein
MSISRREVIRLGAASAAGLILGGHVVFGGLPTTRRVEAEDPAPGKRNAKAVIQIWMWGGPCHIDTFDPKPEAGNDYTGPYTKPIETNVSGIRICEMLPLLAKQADKYSIIRSMTHGNNGHETAAYAVQTGRMPGGNLVYPCAGAVVSLFKGYDAGYNGLIPPYIVLTQPQGRFSEAGFLGSKCKPFATGGDPNQSKFLVEGIVAQNITTERQHARRDLLHQLDSLQAAMPADTRVVAADEARTKAYDLILGESAKIFDLSLEKDDLRERYGRSTFGQSCLMARRLVEQGVPYVTINFGGWDTHKQHFPTMRQKLPDLDRGMSTLIEDLASRGLLDSTIVWWSGEFGRTPKVQWEAPWNGGRGHWGQVFCSVLAGGGFKGGQVVGSSDAKGEAVKDRPVYPADVIASMYQRLGIDPDGQLQHPDGSKVPITPSAADNAILGGRLKEIM